MILVRLSSLLSAAAILLSVPGAVTVNAEELTVAACIEKALNASPSIGTARSRVRLARAQLEQADSAHWPRLVLSSRYSRTDNPTQVFSAAINQRSYSRDLDFNSVPTADGLGLRAELRWSLYSGGSHAAGSSAASAKSAAAGAQEAAVRRGLIHEIVQTYLNLQSRRALVGAAEAAVSAYKENLAVARRRALQGTLLATDVLDVEVRLAQSEERLILAQNGTALTIEALKLLIGLEGDAAIFSSELPPLREPAKGLRQERPELTAAAGAVKGGAERVRQEESGLLPKVWAFAALDYERGWEFGGSGDSYSVGLMGEWEVFDAGFARARVQEARANLDASEENERRLRLQFNYQLQQAQLILGASRQRLKVTAKAFQQAQESAKMTRLRFEQGLALSVQLLDAEAALTAARVASAQARFDEQIALAFLRLAAGLPIIENS